MLKSALYKMVILLAVYFALLFFVQIFQLPTFLNIIASAGLIYATIKVSTPLFKEDKS